MKKLLFITLAGLAFASCAKRTTYNCVVITNTGIGAGVLITTEHTFKGTFGQMIAHENKGTTDSKTTTCN
ncbi:MAG: hypothetical protein ACI8ZM_005125 [Crocinitomix sp.]|jgi:hypothetical protein